MFVEEKHGFPFSRLIIRNSTLPTVPKKCIWQGDIGFIWKKAELTWEKV